MSSGIVAGNKTQQPLHKTVAGYTLVEILTVVVMIGILASVGGLTLLGWLNRLRVNAAQDTALNTIRSAQITATQQHLTWQASFRQQVVRGETVIEWSVHSANTPPIVWNTIYQPGVVVDTANTTFSGAGTQNNPWRVQFNYKGHTNGQLGRITLSNAGGNNRRCVIVSTLLGLVRTATDGRCVR